MIELTDQQVQALDSRPPGSPVAALLSTMFPHLDGRFVIVGVGTGLYLKAHHEAQRLPI